MSGLLILIGACWSVGGLGVARLRVGALESLVLRMYLGLAICAALTLVAGSVSVGLVTYVLCVVMVASAVGARYLRRQSIEKSVEDENPESLSAFDWLCLGGTGAVLGMMFLSALAPVTSWDAGVAHLALPSDYVRDGRIHLLPGNVYSAYPQALHSLFTYAFYMSGERGVMLFCWMLSVLACGTLYCVGTRIGGRRAGILAIAFLATAPIFISQAGTVAIDLPFAGVVLGVVLSLVIWQQERGSTWLVIAGVLVGYGCGIRHTGYVVLVLCALGVLLEGRNVKWTSIFMLAGLLAAAPWFLRSYLLVGNPVYPLLGSVFVDETFAYHQATGLGVHESIRETSVFGFATFPWDMVMHPERYDGWSASPGGWIWILGIPGLIMGGRVARCIGLFSLAGVSSLYMVQRLVRYGIPFFVPMMAVAGLAGSRLSEKSRVLSGLIALGLLFGCGLTAGSMYFKIPVALGMESRDEYLLKRVERYAAFEWVNENLPTSCTTTTTPSAASTPDAATKD